MEIIPAIDLRGGKCVRLYQGDYNQETVFSKDPVDVARHWQSLGARRLHIVDLDGAAKGRICHFSIISSIVAAVKIPVQAGGGIRTMKSIDKLIDAGVDRVILGTAAIENQGLIKESCKWFGNRIIAGVDARNGYVSTRGWVKSSEVTAIELIKCMQSMGIVRFIYTDISRDGTLTEPNFEAVGELIAAVDAKIIAAGGIASIVHLRKLAALGVEGAIVGRALYTGNIDLKKALESIK